MISSSMMFLSLREVGKINPQLRENDWFSASIGFVKNLENVCGKRVQNGNHGNHEHPMTKGG